MSKENTQLEKLTQAIEKLLNKEVAPIAPVAPVAPVLPIIPQNGEDHNLLMRVDVKVDQLIETVNKLNDTTGKRLDKHEEQLRCLETDRITRKDHEDLTFKVDKIDGNQRYYFGWAVGAAAVIAVVASFISNIIK